MRSGFRVYGTHLVEAADDRVAGGGETERVPHSIPQDGHDAGQGEALHQHRQHVLALDDAGVKCGQPRDGHEQDQGCRVAKPLVSTGVCDIKTRTDGTRRGGGGGRGGGVCQMVVTSRGRTRGSTDGHRVIHRRSKPVFRSKLDDVTSNVHFKTDGPDQKNGYYRELRGTAKK